MTARTKHINHKYHFFREHIGASKGIVIKHVATSYNIGDLFTKGLPYDSFAHLRDLLMGWTRQETTASLAAADLEPFDREGVLENDPTMEGPLEGCMVTCIANCVVKDRSSGS